MLVSLKTFFFSPTVAGLMPLHGLKYKLRYIDLHSNCIDSIHHLLQCTVGLHFLTNLILEKDGEGNPICLVPGRQQLIYYDAFLTLKCKSVYFLNLVFMTHFHFSLKLCSFRFLLFVCLFQYVQKNIKNLLENNPKLLLC